MSIVTITELNTFLEGNGVTLSSPESFALAQLHPLIERTIKEYVGYDIEQASHTEFLPSSGGDYDIDDLVIGYEGSPQGAIPLLRGGEEFRSLYVTQLPIRSITTVHENYSAWEPQGVGGTGNWTAASLLTEGPDFYVDWDSPGMSWSGKVIRRGAWPRSRRSVRIIYTAGLTSAELDGRYSNFKTAVYWAVMSNYSQVLTIARDDGGVGTAGVVEERLGDWKIRYSESITSAISGFTVALPPITQKILGPYVNTIKYFGN